MKKLLYFVSILLLAALCYVLLPAKPAQEPSASTPHGEPVFTWQYTDVPNPDFPKVRVSLTATYPDTTTITKELSTVDGSCNDYASPDKDIYQHSTMIICYAAGFGHYFKVVQTSNGYTVLHRTFEEGSPEYTPPETTFAPVAQF